MTALPIAGARGWRLSDLAAYCDLDAGTTYRILQDFIEYRLAFQDPANRRYVFGPMAAELALSLPVPLKAMKAINDSLRYAAEQTGASAHYAARSGTEYVVTQSHGLKPKGTVLEIVGMRRPLVWSTAGIAILVALPPKEAEAAVTLSLKQLAHFQSSLVKSRERLIYASMQYKHAINIGITVPGIHSYGIAVLKDDRPVGSITLLGNGAQLPGEKAPTYFKILLRAAGMLSVQA